MKVKSIFLSMLAIAALASCTKEEATSPPGPEGGEKVIELTIGGAPLSVKSTTASDNDADQTITDLTVFGVSTTGAIVTKKYFSSTDVTAETGQAKSVNFETKTTTESLYAIANIGSDLTGSDLNVSTLAELKTKTASLLKTSGGGGDKVPSQTQGNVLMSGTTSTITLQSGTTYTASITLGFISTKLILHQLKRGASSQGAYGTDFTIEGAILNNVQTSAHYVATSGSYIPTTLTTGLTTSSIADKVTDFNNAITIGTSQATDFDANKVVDLNYHWYVFENTQDDKPTTLLLHYKWKAKSTDTTMKDMYFPVTLKAGQGFDGKLEPGKAYSITMTLSGDFRTETDGGGSGGGGTEDPDKPVTNGSITVTVTPTAWNAATVDKEF